VAVQLDLPRLEHRATLSSDAGDFSH
jgi:hypothetical protein